MSSALLCPFPQPPRLVRHALDELSSPERADRDLAGWRVLDRPWDPAGCSPLLRTQLWPWLDDVATWINHEYGWQTAHVIPACWPRHPHLVHELAVLACLRAAAADAPGPHSLEDWHRYALPGFCQRMADRLGLGCPPGRHTDWPARSRQTEYSSPTAVEARNERFEADTGARGMSTGAPGDGPLSDGTAIFDPHEDM